MRSRSFITIMRTGLDFPFRLRVGVTGQRILGETDKPAEGIRRILKQRMPELFDHPLSGTGVEPPFAYTIVTPLAEGADRLVAREVLKIPDSDMEVVLPLDRTDYLRDFSTPASKKDFEELLGQARKIVRLKESPPRDPRTVPDLMAVRNKAYEDAGRYVVDHSDVLIALWDFTPSQGQGGTADIVAYAREKRSPLAIVSLKDPGAIVMEKGRGLSRRTLDRIGLFNRFPVSAEKERAYTGAMEQKLFQNAEGGKISPAVRSLIKAKLLPSYVRASLIANKNRKKYLRAGLLVYSLSPLAVAAVAAGSLSPSWAPFAYGLEFVLLIVIYMVIFLADRKKVHAKWVEARALIERIRGAIFLSACGVEASPIIQPPFQEPARRSDDWIFRVFHEIVRRMGPPVPGDREECGVCVAFVRKHWLHGQIEFHAAKARRSGKISRRLEISGRAVFLAAIGAAGWHLSSIMIGHPSILAGLEKPVTFFALVLPAVGAAVGGIRLHREYSRLEKRSRDMEAALTELDREFSRIVDFSGLKTLLIEAEALMLQETQDWFRLMKFAKVEVI